MNILKLVLLTLLSFCFFSSTFAHSNASGFMTARDLLKSGASFSNISLQNNRNVAVTVYGLYIAQYAHVLPGQRCVDAIPTFLATDNITAGAFVTPTVIGAGKKALVSGNYLYNMIYQAIYYANVSALSPKCSLPGCTWGDDSTIYYWCIYLGALAPVFTTAGYTSNVPPSADQVSDTGVYDYSLVNNYIYLGPISCNDVTQSCMTESQQTQTFS